MSCYKRAAITLSIRETSASRMVEPLRNASNHCSSHSTIHDRRCHLFSPARCASAQAITEAIAKVSHIHFAEIFTKTRCVSNHKPP